jgi:hypothetical protein
MTDGDRIDDIRERLEAYKLKDSEDAYYALRDQSPDDIEWLLNKLDQAHKTYYRMYDLDKEEIDRLRDEVNALWDVVWSLTNSDEEVDKASAYFLERYNANVDSRMKTREALANLIELSEDLPGGYLGDK